MDVLAKDLTEVHAKRQMDAKNIKVITKLILNFKLKLSQFPVEFHLPSA